ncbi:MAG: DUF5681 domain-containing protein [Xanthobacteraceae bacterium]
MTKRRPKSPTRSQNSATPADGEQPGGDGYQVGYGRPPRHSRFKKGRSGNPNGRPHGRANAKAIVSRAINEKVTVREGDKARDMTKLEGLLQAHLVKAIKGDARSATLVIGLLAKLGLLAETEEETFTTLSEEDRAILAEFVQSQTGAAGSSPADPGANGHER